MHKTSAKLKISLHKKIMLYVPTVIIALLKQTHYLRRRFETLRRSIETTLNESLWINVKRRLITSFYV